MKWEKPVRAEQIEPPQRRSTSSLGQLPWWGVALSSQSQTTHFTNREEKSSSRVYELCDLELGKWPLWVSVSQPQNKGKPVQHTLQDCYDHKHTYSGSNTGYIKVFSRSEKLYPFSLFDIFSPRVFSFFISSSYSSFSFLIFVLFCFGLVHGRRQGPGLVLVGKRT